jgi:hypothetical protein
MNIVNGKGGISAEIIADSINVWGDRVTTFKLHYHRFIHSEFMTHKMLSKNASSSRAIPVKSILDKIEEQPAIPIHFGQNKSGMQAEVENSKPIKMNVYDEYGDITEETYNVTNEQAWHFAKNCAIKYANKFADAGYHKQIVNRLTEPFQFINVLSSATDYDNFFWLRQHKDAQPEIQELANCMFEAKEQSTPEVLRFGEWHTPFVEHERNSKNELTYHLDGDIISKELAIKISISASAQISYRKNDTSIEKAKRIFDMLMNGERLHGSPMEHVATPYSETEYMDRLNAKKNLLNAYGVYYEPEIAEKFADQVMYCGNFRGWTQERKLMANENYKG